MNKKFANFSSGRILEPWLRASYATFQGDKREYMEDRVSTFKFTLSHSKFYCFLVLDGHGGSAVADFVLTHLPRFLKSDLLKKNMDIKAGIDQTFCRLNSAVLAYASGTTISLLLIRVDKTGKRETYSANVGDSSMYGIYMKEDAEKKTSTPQFRKISFDHDTEKKHELKRIQDSPDHFIEDGYVGKGDYLLAMTRAVGDSNLGDVVKANPRTIKLNKPYTFYILASDGYWDITTAKTIWTQYQKLVIDGQWKRSAKIVSDWRNATFEQHDNTSLMFVFVN